jgi:hypothetical protein
MVDRDRHFDALAGWRSQIPWRRGPHLSVDCQFLGPPPGPFAQVPFGVCLQPPGDLADQIRLVARPRFFAKDLRVSPPDFASRQLLQRSNFCLDIELHGHFLGFSVPLTPDTTRDSQPCFAENLKALGRGFGAISKNAGFAAPDSLLVAQHALCKNGRDAAQAF